MFALIKPPVDPWSLLLFLCVFRFISDLNLLLFCEKKVWPLAGSNQTKYLSLGWLLSFPTLSANGTIEEGSLTLTDYAIGLKHRKANIWQKHSLRFYQSKAVQFAFKSPKLFSQLLCISKPHLDLQWAKLSVRVLLNSIRLFSKYVFRRFENMFVSLWLNMLDTCCLLEIGPLWHISK